MLTKQQDELLKRISIKKEMLSLLNKIKDVVSTEQKAIVTNMELKLNENHSKCF